MNVHYSDNRKIDPSQGTRLGDGTENDGNRVEIGPQPHLPMPNGGRQGWRCPTWPKCARPATNAEPMPSWRAAMGAF